MILGYRLRELRKEMRMSQGDLGKLLGVTKVSVSGYENGTRVPSMSVLILILDVFGTSADYLLGRELNAVCEDNDSISVSISSVDIDIIHELKAKPVLYNEIANDPKRFFSLINKKNI